jgi:uncharacterized membrane protein
MAQAAATSHAKIGASSDNDRRHANGSPAAAREPSRSLKRNIEALEERCRQEAVSATRQERLAEAIISFTGSNRFVYLHLALCAVRILANLVKTRSGTAAFDGPRADH